MKLRFLLPLALMAPGLSVAREAPSEAPPGSVKGITARELGGHMRFLASDLMRGRDTASAEIRVASEYLASRLFAAGAEPAGDDGPGGKTCFQSFPLEIVTPKVEGIALELILERDGARQVIPCKLGTDFTLFPQGIAPGELDAPVVFGGLDRAGEEAMRDFTALELENRWVALQASGDSGRRGGAGASKIEVARKRGALGILTVPAPDSPPFRGTPEGRTVEQEFGRPSMTLGPAPASIPTLNLSESLRDRIFRAAGPASGPEKPRALQGVRARFTFAAVKAIKHDRNVVGLLPGADPEKAKEVILFSAHYDHVGVNDKGEIFNGSDDNASGTGALLEIAEAMGEGPRPARGVAFLWVSGEEQGLLGSRWFADHVSLPPGLKIVADINLDMVSRNDGKKVGVTPSPEHADYSDLIPAARELSKAEGIEAVFDADAFYSRTDSYNFARKGIPVIFFFSGVHEDYHRPTDDVEKADFEKAARIARAAYRLGYRFAQAAEAPKKIKADETSKADQAGTP